MEDLSARMARKSAVEESHSGKSSSCNGGYRGAAELWRPIAEAAQQFGLKPGAITQRLIPMSYYPEPMKGRIRFRVMGKPRRTELWFPDLAAMEARRGHTTRAESSPGSSHAPSNK